MNGLDVLFGYCPMKRTITKTKREPKHSASISICLFLFLPMIGEINLYMMSSQNQLNTCSIIKESYNFQPVLIQLKKLVLACIHEGVLVKVQLSYSFYCLFVPASLLCLLSPLHIFCLLFATTIIMVNKDFHKDFHKHSSMWQIHVAICLLSTILQPSEPKTVVTCKIKMENICKNVLLFCFTCNLQRETFAKHLQKCLRGGYM